MKNDKGRGRPALGETIGPIMLEVLFDLGTVHPIHSDWIFRSHQRCESQDTPIHTSLTYLEKLGTELLKNKKIRIYSDENNPLTFRVCLWDNFPGMINTSKNI